MSTRDDRHLIVKGAPHNILSQVNAIESPVLSGQLLNFTKYAEFSEAAYCAETYDSRVGNNPCANTEYPRCENLRGFATEYELSANRAAIIKGYIASGSGVSQIPKEIVIAFKGTQTNSEIFTDVKVRQKVPNAPGRDPSLPLCQGCLVLHTGFWDAFVSVKDGLLQHLQEVTKNVPNSRIVVTGHSLGGAVATIAGAYLRKNNSLRYLFIWGSNGGQ
ncbi:hypothetical protein C2857_000197 [Epichloe festucae Fl1]|uniref:Fungal lipase-type domain-containing protein n=1 Tax=Epichloe festucae (strain Fl1) TaxID=877507 RepID=A0A7S9KV80_EPIFF|nr:hypothetical protein C2857_000197 [Epichloe festucae Fl1]